MKFDISKKALIIIASCIGGLIVLGGVLSVVGHGRYDGRGFEKNFGRGFGNVGCNANFSKGNQADMMSGVENIIATKDYVAFQTLFSGNRMLEQINTPEKFATRVELQTTMKTVQNLEAKLGLGDKGDFCPMMLDDRSQGQEGCGMMGNNNTRGNRMRRR